MKFVIQRVNEAKVEVQGKTTGQIGKGFLVLIGIEENDTQKEADRLVRKLLGLRIFADEEGKMNLSLDDVGGELLLVSQFTLCADCRKGNRPSFTGAAQPERANELYEYIVKQCRLSGKKTECGIFGADMSVSLVNDGPFTIIFDTDEM